MKKRLSRISLLLLAGLGLCLPIDALAGKKGSKGGSVITDVDAAADSIAVAIAVDSGRSVKTYRSYSTRLAQTLAILERGVIDRVLQEHLAAVTGVSAPSAPSDPGGTSTPANDPAVDGPLIGMLNGTPWTPPGTLADNLLEASPLSEAVLAEVIVADDVMPPGGTVDILLSNMPLPTSVYDAIVAGNSDLWGSQIQTIIDAQAAATSAP